MKISLITPAGKQSRAGNRATAVRWAKILRDLGHRVEVLTESLNSNADMMIAIHAWRSLNSIKAFNDAHPDRPLIVLLAGTDIYHFQNSHPSETYESMERASALVCLHDLVWRSIPQVFRNKLKVIYQSSDPLTAPRSPSKKRFELCVIGHLRDEKDSLRPALAARLLPQNSRIRIVHFGKAHNAEWEEKVSLEASLNTRFDWKGEVPRWSVRRQYQRSHAMIISSNMEGGANVLSEAIVCGLPVIASDIDGNIGLLGEDYEGYFKVRDEIDLAQTLGRAENDINFLKKLESQVISRQKLFVPELERRKWKELIKSLT